MKLVSLFLFCVLEALVSDVQATQCVNNICGFFEYCCNESCGECAYIFSGYCTTEYCCPTPSEDIFCDSRYAPVVCADGCEYDNKCLAEAAGQDITTCEGMSGEECGPNSCEIGEVCCNESCGICTPPDGVCTHDYCCPEPLSDTFCPFDYNPVKCIDECVYDNSCQAEAAGQVGCCPTPNDVVSCPGIHNPVTCADGCEYENDCLAMAAGQDIKTCHIVGPKCGSNTCEIGQVCCNESCGICAPPDGVCTEEYCCPTPSEDVFCPLVHNPVTCNDGCKYDNDCLARAAGQSYCNPI